MEKNSLIRFSLILFIAIGISFSSCNKDKVDESAPDTSTLQQLSKDESEIQTASDDAINDVDGVLSDGTSKSRWKPLNSTLDSANIVGDTITYTITFNGVNKTGKLSRTGVIKIKKSISTNWKTAGDKVFITFINFKVTRVSTTKSITFNGTKLFTNVSGGILKLLGNGFTQVIHEVSGSLSITFDDGTIKAWNIARRKTFTGTPGQFVLTVEGFGTSGTYTNLETWGVNRNNETFYSKINTPVVIKETCGWDPVSGIISHEITSNSSSAIITFGYDNNNQPVTSASTICPTKYKLDWVKNAHSGTVYIFL